MTFGFSIRGISFASKKPGFRELFHLFDRSIKGNQVAAKKHGKTEKDPIDLGPPQLKSLGYLFSRELVNECCPVLCPWR